MSQPGGDARAEFRHWRYRAAPSRHPGEWHSASFAAFDLAKRALGEPTPHIDMVRHMSDGLPEEELIWRAGCYAVGYSLLTAEALWTAWPHPPAPNDPRFGDWLREHWAGMHTRTPRRNVRRAGPFEQCLRSYALWTREELPHLRREGSLGGPRATYDRWWGRALHIWGMGRYIVIRLLELYRRWGLMPEDAILYDIRAMEAESPIRCLMLLRPELAPELMRGDPADVDAIASDVIAAAPSGLTYFRFAALLCEYRKAYEGGGDYAGNQTDEELGYFGGRHAAHWEGSYRSAYWLARQVLVPWQCRGEDRGWTGVRPLAAQALRDHGVVWSDSRYDYHASLAAGSPVPWLRLADMLP